VGWLFSILGELQKLNVSFAALLPLIKELTNKMTAIDDALTQLESDVTNLTTVEQSAVALLNGLTTQIQTIIAAGGDPAKTLASIQDVVTKVESDTTDLAKAVAANTPAAPAKPAA